MANQFFKYNPATGREAMWQFKEALKACGWVHQASGTGSGGAFTTTPGNANDLLTALSKFANNNSWWVGRSPDGQREILLQNGASATAWAIAYSFDAHFTGGTPSATVSPTATDGKNVFGLQNATYYSFFAADGTYRWKIMVQDAAPYGWWALGHPTAGGVGWTAVAMDPLKSGSFPAEDVDPYEFYVASAQMGAGHAWKYTSFASESANTTWGCWAFLKKGLAGEAWVNTPAVYYQNGSRMVTPPGPGTNPHNAKDDMFPVLYIRPAALAVPTGYKGVSSFFHWTGVARSVGDTLSKVTPRDFIVVGDCVAPWDGTVPEV